MGIRSMFIMTVIARRKVDLLAFGRMLITAQLRFFEPKLQDSSQQKKVWDDWCTWGELP